MRRPWSFFLVIFASGWISVLPALASGPSLNVVTSVIPVAYIVEELGGERVKVDTLVPPGASPHTFEPVPSDMRKLARARQLVIVGGGLDAWSEQLLGAASQDIEIVRLIEAPNLKPLEGEHHHHHHGEEKVAEKEQHHGDHHHGEEKVAEKEHHDHHHDEKKVAEKEHHDHHHGEEKVAEKEQHHGEHHDHGEEKMAGKDEHHGEEGEGLDPHFWLDPIRVRDAVVPVLVERLTAADPAGKAWYERRRQDFHERLTALHQRIAAEMDRAKTRRYIAFHAAWPYFAERYGLEKVAVVQEFAGEEPTPREVANLVRSARALGVGAILVEPQLDSRVARTLAAEFDAGTVMVDPLGDPGDPARDTYEELMLFNARAFRQAMKGKGN